MSATMEQCHYMSLAVACEDCIIHLEWFDCDDEEYQSGWYWFEDDGPPGYFGNTAKEAADELRKFFKQAAGRSG